MHNRTVKKPCMHKLTSLKLISGFLKDLYYTTATAEGAEF